jgi:hypothetical protein
MSNQELVHVPRSEDDPERREPNAVKGQTTVAAHRVRVAQRRSEVSALILAKIPQREIARRLSVGLGTVGDDVKAIKAMWAERSADAYETHVAEEVAKLDWLERAFLPAAFTADVDAAVMLLKIMDRRARLLGLDKPAKLEVAHTDADAQRQRAEELLSKADELAQRRARQTG